MPAEVASPQRTWSGVVVSATGAGLRALVLAIELVIVAIAVLAVTLHWRVVIVRSESMRPGLPAGSLVLIRPVPVGTIRAGMVIGADLPGRPMVLHRVVAVGPAARPGSAADRQQPAVRVRLKGDAERTADPQITVRHAFGPAVILPGLLALIAVWDTPTQQFVLGLGAGVVLVLQLSWWLRCMARAARAARARPGLAAATGQLARPAAVPARTPARTADPLEADRRALLELGVPEAWLHRMRGGDRFDAVLAMLEPVPDLTEAPSPDRVAVLGPRGPVQREAYRIAVDLQEGLRPSPVFTVAEGPRRERDLRRLALVPDAAAVLAIECASTATSAEAQGALELAELLGAGLVIAVAQAQDAAAAMGWIRSTPRLDALAVDGTPATGDLMDLLGLGLPVIRIDGIGTDRHSITSLLCGRLQAYATASTG